MLVWFNFLVGLSSSIIFLIFVIIQSSLKYGTTTLEEFHGSFSPTKARPYRQRREGVTLNQMVGERPLPHREANSQAVGRGSRALSGNREVMRANLNVPQPRIPSARVVEVDSSSDDEFQDSNTEPAPRSLAESITATRVPQVTTQQTNQPSPTQPRHQYSGPNL